MKYIHPLADVKSEQIGDGTYVWQFAVVLGDARIGTNCNINCHTFVENDVIIGNNVTIKSGVYLWNGMRIADNVFIGPNVTFTNDKYPRSKVYPSTFQVTHLKENCSIGANATILGGITIGKFAIIGAGSVVTKDVPAHALVLGNPAKIAGWIDEKGQRFRQTATGELLNTDNERFIIEGENLVRL